MFSNVGGSALIDVNIIFEKSSIKEGDKIADLGCGRGGFFVFPAAKIVGKRGIVYAVDILKNVLSEIKRQAKEENLNNIVTIWSDLEIFGATQIDSNSLDIAFLINTLHQSKKKVEILRESIRMVKKEGKLLIVDWKKIAAPFGPPSETKVNKEALKIAAPKLGLHLEEEFEVGQYHFGLNFTKM